MAITTLDSMISGLQAPIDFIKGLTGTMVAGRPVDLTCAPTTELAKWYSGYYIGWTTPGSPNTQITIGDGTATPPFSVGQEVSVSSASSAGSHEIDGLHTVVGIATGVVTVSTATSTNPGSGGMLCSRETQNNPGVGGINGAVMTSFPAQLPFTNPASGNTYLARLEAQAPIAGTLLLCDRLWFAAGIDAWRDFTEPFSGIARIPARDMNGANNGDGVLAAVVTLGAWDAADTDVGTATLTYTNQAGTTGHTASLLIPAVAKPPTGTFYPIGLQDGDTGIRQVESLTVTKWGIAATYTQANSLGLVLYRVLARLPLVANVRGVIDALTGCFPRLFDNTVPFLVFMPQTTTSSYVMGMAQYAQG